MELLPMLLSLLPITDQLTYHKTFGPNSKLLSTIKLMILPLDAVSLAALPLQELMFKMILQSVFTATPMQDSSIIPTMELVPATADFTWIQPKLSNAMPVLLSIALSVTQLTLLSAQLVSLELSSTTLVKLVPVVMATTSKELNV